MGVYQGTWRNRAESDGSPAGNAAWQPIGSGYTRLRFATRKRAKERSINVQNVQRNRPKPK